MLYISLMITTKQKHIVDIQKVNKKKSKQMIIENHQIKREKSNRRKEQRNLFKK